MLMHNIRHSGTTKQPSNHILCQTDPTNLTLRFSRRAQTGQEIKEGWKLKSQSNSLLRYNGTNGTDLYLTPEGLNQKMVHTF